MVSQPASFQTMLAVFRKLRAQGLQKHTMLPTVPHFDFLQPMFKMTTRFGCSSAEERASIMDEAIPGKTKRATGTWVRAFSEYCSDLNLKTCTASKLAPKLEGFYADLRKQDGSIYKRASYIAARGALQRHLTFFDSTFSIYKDKEFVKANSVLNGVLKQNKESCLEEGVEHKRALSAEDWDLVQEYFKKVSMSSDPVSHCRYVWFVVSLHFCLKACEIHSQLNKCDLVFGKDENDCDIITLSKDFMSKNHQGGLKGSAFSSAGCITDSEQVATVRRYLDHLHRSCQLLFQRARIASQPEVAAWFMNMPLSHNLVGKMMSQISADAKLFFIQQSQQSVSNCNNEIPRINTTPTITSTLTNFKTTPTDVEDLLQQLDTSKSNGSDGIPTRLLKEAASELAPSLSALFNLSFETGQTPQEWRDATVTPIHKKGTKSSPTNYRPISLLPVVSKVQERVVYNRLYSHIQQHLPTHQSGFRQCDGTELQLARINHEISAHRDSGHHVSACFFDLSKAFDRVWHPGLLKKLFHYGVEAEAHIWLTRYLSGRRQRVQVDGTVSPWLGVPAGVPQGSVLGPLLFLTYTIDLPNACINDDTTCSQFADDTALIASTSSPQQTEQQLQRAVTSAAKWLNDWHLLVNIDKTVTMTFYHDNRPPAHLPTIFLNDSPLKTVRQQRHLGVIFQHNLQWSTHVNNIINKSLKVLHMLTKLRNSLNSSALSYLYCTYIRPILEYACIAVTPLPHNILDRLERIQRKAARICLHLPLFSPVDHSSLLHRLQLPTLFSRRRIKQLLLSHSIFHHYAPPHLLQLQLPPLAANVYSLRRPRSYHLPTSRTDRLKDSPIFRALHYFNSLPDAMKSIKDRTMFKSEIHSLFVSSICPCSDHPLPYV